MAGFDRGFIPERLQKIFLKIMSPLISFFTKWSISPNAISIAGLIITSFAAAAFTVGRIRLGGILVLLGGLCDTFDGSIARSAGSATHFGAFVDSVIDRYCELVMFFGITAHFVWVEDYLTSIVAFVALCGSIMVSYCRARAESLGFEAKIGIMQRPERIVLLGFGALIHIIAFKIAIWAIAILANATALQRIRYTSKQNQTAVEHQEKSETKDNS
jgi:CDP-diacylglycerol--glycerol-3-phosphate 3-phosphatidyltransferase